MYKVVKGQRNPPSHDIILKISQFMRLTQQEQQLLTDAWQFTVLGLKNYNRRKSIDHFLIYFPDDFSPMWDKSIHREVPLAVPENLPSFAECLALETQKDVNSYLLYIVSKEASKEHGSVSLLLQPDNKFLFQSLSSMTPHYPLTVEHVFYINHAETLTSDNQFLIIQYLETIFPLFTTARISYTPLYCYGDVQAGFSSYSLFPCIVLTSEYALMYTPDYQQGILYTDPMILESLRKDFIVEKEKAKSLFEIANVDLAYPAQYLPIKNLVNPDCPTYIIQQEGCLLPLLHPEMIQEFLNSSFQNKELIVRQYGEGIVSSRETQMNLPKNWLFQFFTRNGLLYFVRTGRFRELPSSIVAPLSLEDRITILKDFQSYCKIGMFRMLHAPLEHLPGNLRLVVSGKIGYLVLCKENAPLIYMFFKEPTLIELFRAYMESLTDYCYSTEVTNDYIQEMIDSLVSQCN